MTNVTKIYAQPWPLCWQLMQWDLVLWASIAKSNTIIQVTWNEATLRNQIAPTDFQQSIQDFKQALTLQLGKRLNWQFDMNTQSSAHAINLIASTALLNDGS